MKQSIPNLPGAITIGLLAIILVMYVLFCDLMSDISFHSKRIYSKLSKELDDVLTIYNK